MPSVPLETIRGAKLGPNDHGCSCGQGNPAPATGMAALPMPSPPGPDLGENEELKAAHPQTPGVWNGIRHRRAGIFAGGAGQGLRSREDSQH